MFTSEYINKRAVIIYQVNVLCYKYRGGGGSVYVSKFPSIFRYALRATQDERKFNIFTNTVMLLWASSGVHKNTAAVW